MRRKARPRAAALDDQQEIPPPAQVLPAYLAAWELVQSLIPITCLSQSFRLENYSAERADAMMGPLRRVVSRIEADRIKLDEALEVAGVRGLLLKANELKPVTICGIKAVSFAHALSRLVRELGLGMGAHETDRWRIFANTVWPNLFQVGLAEKLRAISDADFLPELEAESLRVATLLADQAKEERLTAPQRDVAPITDTAAWPPDAEWHFRPGQYAYDSKSFDLIGAKWLLLKKLASNLTRHFPLTELRDAACGPDSPTSPTSIRPLLTKLRKILVKNHDLPEDADPIPGDGKGQGAVWWLDMNNRKPLKRPKKKQKQR